MLALASLLERLRDDPGTVGKRYQLTVRARPDVAGRRARACPAWRDAGAALQRRRRRLVPARRAGPARRLPRRPHALRGAAARRRAGGCAAPDEVEVGVGLADALGLRPGSTLAAQLPGGGEVRFRVAGIVRALENDGRIAWVRPDRLLAADPDLPPQVVVRLDARRRPRGGRAPARGARRAAAAGRRRDDPTTRAFLGVLAAVLRGVGLAVGARLPVRARPGAGRDRARAPRRGRAAARVRRATAPTVGARAGRRRGAPSRCPAALAGVVLEALGARPARRAAGRRLRRRCRSRPTAGQIALVVAGLLALAAVATALVARRVLREPIVAGLREE